MIVDSHHHLWRFRDVADHHPEWHAPAYDRIARDFEPGDLRAELESAMVERTVLVQAIDTPAENDRLIEHAHTLPYVAGVVAWLPLSEPEVAQAELNRWDRDPAVRGVRRLIGHDPAGWLLERGPLAVLGELAERGLTWDVVVVAPEQAAHVLHVAETLPRLPIVVDHLGRPPIDSGGWQPWADWIRRVGEHPNIAVKVSVGVDVLTSWPRWSGAALDRYVGWVAEQVGPSRMMLASNWPVVLLRNGYTETLSSLEQTLTTVGLSEAESAQVRAGTAEQWYGLPASPTSSSDGEGGWL